MSQVSPSQAERASALAAELRAIAGKLKRKLREQGGENDLRPSQVSVLLRLEKDGPAPVSTLARAEGMRPQSMSAIVTSLLEAELVTGSPDPNDGRQTLMALSRKCQKLLTDGRAARQDEAGQAPLLQFAAQRFDAGPRLSRLRIVERLEACLEHGH